MAGYSQQRLANYCEPKDNSLTSNSKQLTTTFMHLYNEVFSYSYSNWSCYDNKHALAEKKLNKTMGFRR
jgi:hypothetical protein